MYITYLWCLYYLLTNLNNNKSTIYHSGLESTGFLPFYIYKIIDDSHILFPLNH